MTRTRCKGCFEIIVLLLFLFLLSVLSMSEDGVTLTRHRRYLTYPDADPARVQLIIGIGLPLDLEDESVTIGYVIKMLYHIPQNSTDYTVHFYEATSNVRSQRSIDFEESAEHNKLHVGENQDEIKGETTKSNRTDKDSHEQDLMKPREEEEQENTLKENRKTNRWDIYKLLEQMLEQNGMSGRACILRTICEAAETPFTFHGGILGELAHIIFTPSTSRDKLSHHTDNEYHAAEHLGLDPKSDCEYLFPECQQSVLEIFSEIRFSSMFG